jgi:hypothetical protein
MISGEWCPSYLQRLENKFTKGKISEDKYNAAREFIVNKIANIQLMQNSYEAMSLEEKRQYRITFEKLKNEMCEYFLKIINGRVNSFRLRTSLKNYEDVNDIIQDAFITVMTYINRYNDAQATSAFAYVTQLATNSILFSLNEIKEREDKMVSGLDFYENLNTLDDPMGSDGLNKFIE